MNNRLARELRANIALSGALFVAIEFVVLYRAAGRALVALLLVVVFTVTLSSGMRMLSHSGTRVRRARGLLSAVANLGIPMLLALSMFTSFGPAFHRKLTLAICAAMGSALADTLSHDIGIFDPNVYSILTWRNIQPGQDGGVSLLGSFAGIATALMFAFLVFALGLSSAASAPIIVLAIAVGNAMDSLLGATLQSRGILSNEAVNLLSTSCAAAVIVGLVS